MTAVAVMSTALCAGLAVAAVMGQMPSLRVRRSSHRRSGRLEELVSQSGTDRTAGQILAASVLSGIAAGALIASITPVAVLAIVPAALCGATPIVVLRRKAQQRLRLIRQAWPDALAQISGNVRAGRPLSHALIDVSVNGPAALAAPLTGLTARIQTVGLVPALHAVRDLLADPVTDRIVEVLELAHTEGGRIVLDVIDDLADAVSAEVAAAEETETLALEGKLNARIVFALPWVVLAMLTAQPGPFQSFYTQPSGTIVIAIGAVLSLAGIALATRLSGATPEPRVLLTSPEVRR
ncbi:MAG: type II secretion system F family protein [Euzebya sp.]